MPKEFRKVENPTESQLEELVAKGWTYEGPLQVKQYDEDGNVVRDDDGAPVRTDSDSIHRFSRPVAEASESDDDIELSPDDVKVKIRALTSAD